ncbi:TonB-dependent receptor [Winogradskyella litorisediminis]|uniref:TonB-dependent receptor n=2 Tax=Winogradskyella litorisediminis TaxID=1156618 RepID=A0ABW3NA28_9FLAO
MKLKMNQKLVLIISLIIFNFTNAQIFSGKVVNDKNQPLEAAYIYNLNSKSHAHSAINGTFTIDNTKAGDSLRVGLLGYKTQTLYVKNEEKLQVVLAEKAFELKELVISEEINALTTKVKLDLQTNPVNSSQEILRKVPGLFIGQHAGGGKAEQIFLRGFDIDHGTDVSISVDGIPVNMVSHAHGQGYSDLHFIIPETINKIDFGKGGYYADQGDFNTAGYVDFSTKEYLNESSINVSVGQFNTVRTVGLFDLLEKKKNQNAYMAVEYIETDGPFEAPQSFNRLNLFGKYTAYADDNSKVSLTASHFTSRWDASGQIPQRAVDDGSISRFGAIDATEGGETSRTNVNVEFFKAIDSRTNLTANAFYSQYAFELYSNFTFFLEDPINGDQIRQKEDRNIFGANAAVDYTSFLGDVELDVTAGLGLRHDVNDDVELSKTRNRRETLENIQLGDINQTNMNAFVEATFDFGKFKISPALRLDYFNFLYNDQLQPTFETQSERKAIISPKLNLFYNANDNLQLYAKSGLGFHSNDARVVVSNEGRDILPRSYGTDLGVIWKPTPDLLINTAAWYLFLEQEFVYVGDAGIVEPSGKTERYGLDLGLRYQINNWLFFDSDATITKARAIEENDGEDFIPLAPDFTLTSGLSINNLGNFSGGLRVRYLDDRPANEDNSIVAEGYVVTDFNLNYKLNKITIGFAIENLFDVEWNETQFATESRLQNEVNPVEEIHFTPGTQFFLKGNITYRF